MKKLLRLLMLIAVYALLAICCMSIIGKIYNISILFTVNIQFIIGIICGILAIILAFYLIKSANGIVRIEKDSNNDEIHKEYIERDIDDITTVFTTKNSSITNDTIVIKDEYGNQYQEKKKDLSEIKEITNSIEKINEHTPTQKINFVNLSIPNDTIVEKEENVKEKDIDIELTETQKSYISLSKTSYIDDNGRPQFFNTGTNTLKMKMFKDYDKSEEVGYVDEIVISHNKLVKILLMILGSLLVVLIILSTIYFIKMAG